MIKSNKIWYCFKTFSVIGLLLAVFESCTSTTDRPEPPVDDLQTVTFTVRMPYATPKTYAMTDSTENAIKTTDVLAFRVDKNTLAETYDYRAEGSEIMNTVNTIPFEKQFKVTLLKNDSIKYRFVFLANVKSELDAYSLPSKVGVARATLLAQLYSNTTGAWHVTSPYQDFPMWGQNDPPIAITQSTTGITGITLLRSIASIDVIADAAAVKDSFLLEDVTLYNRKTSGRVAPADANYNTAGKVVTAPTLPVPSSTTFTGLLFSVPPSTWRSERTIYTYEADSIGDDYSVTCLVIGGIFVRTGIKQYYRLDFDVRDGLGAFVRYRPVLRNHRYQFTITAVTGDGHNTADLAFYGKKGNMDVEILAWNLGDLDGADIKEEHVLSLSQPSMEVAGAGSYTGYVGVSTTHPGGWTAVRENAADTWITSVNYSNDSYMVIELAGSPPASPGRTGYILVKAGNMTKRFKVVQHL